MIENEILIQANLLHTSNADVPFTLPFLSQTELAAMNMHKGKGEFCKDDLLGQKLLVGPSHGICLTYWYIADTFVQYLQTCVCI